MIRILALIVSILCFPALTLAQEAQIRKVMIFPIKVVAKTGADQLNNEMAGVLGAELSREGDIDVISGMPFATAVQEKRVDPQRLVRIAERMGAQAVIWGNATQLDEGVALELSVMPVQAGKRPRLFTANAKDNAELMGRMREISAEIGATVLNRPKVGEIKIDGNKRIQREAILNKLEMKSGAPFRKSAIGDEIREIYSMGYFEDVQIKAQEAADGKMDLYITLKERPSIKNIELDGVKIFSKDEILDALTTKSFSVASVQKIRNDIEKIKAMYEKEGYYQPQVDYEIKELSPSEATLTFKIDEGRKSYLTEIILDGRAKLDEKDIKKALTLKEKSWFWFLDESGSFTREKLEENRMRLLASYLENGFINVQVGAPKIDITDGSVKVTFPIREGDRFQVRKIEVEGDLIAPAEQLLEQLQVKPKTWFKRSAVAEDIKTLTKLYNNQGYAYADVEPMQKMNDEHDFVDLTFKVTKGDKVSIERVDITGNDRTRDKIIRRALMISEGDIYNSDSFERSEEHTSELQSH